MAALRFFAVTVAVLFLVLALACRSIQRQALFHPTHEAHDNGLTRWLHGGALYGYAHEVPAPRNVWFMLHGNAGQAADRSYALSAFAPDDSVYIMEYPGYGARAGKPSRESFDAAARAAYADLRARFPATPVCVVGESIGSGPAAMLARETRPPDKLVFVVPFDDLESVGSDHLPYLPMSLLLAGTWNNVEALRGYRGPVDVFGAERDEVIPIRHAQALAGSVPQARFQTIPGGHNDWSMQAEVRIRNP